MGEDPRCRIMRSNKVVRRLQCNLLLVALFGFFALSSAVTPNSSRFKAHLVPFITGKDLWTVGHLCGTHGTLGGPRWLSAWLLRPAQPSSRSKYETLYSVNLLKSKRDNARLTCMCALV